MTITKANTDSCLARLDSWRMKAAAAGRDADVELLDAISKFLHAHHTDQKNAVTPMERRSFVPRGIPATAKVAECCPYAGPKNIGCKNCEITRDKLFTLPDKPERVYACALKWADALWGRDKTFEAKV